MSKTNFTKVEEALTEGLRRIQLDKLLKEADAAKGTAGDEAATKATNAATLAEGHRRVHALKMSIKWLSSKDPDLYLRLGVEKADITKFLDAVDKFTDKDWATFKILHDKVDKAKLDLAAMQGVGGNEDMIAQQRQKHIHKRFNVQDKWLPLK